MITNTVEKRLIKIEIEELEVDSNDFDTFKVEVDQESLHPYYVPSVLKAPEYLSKEDKFKISKEIDKFILIRKKNPQTSNRIPSIQNNSSGEQNESEEPTRKKFKRNKRSRNALCSSSCIIGWDYLG